ncbi:hypothetical protein ACFYWN_00360 [Streptomyces sp. NPDC002917]|uniref:hypothetical protein n=1 Tax=Streptomyces sp. NPDC002917 TaxID=3364671 RepID=UPI0036D193CE
MPEYLSINRTAHRLGLHPNKLRREMSAHPEAWERHMHHDGTRLMLDFDPIRQAALDIQGER